MSLKKTSHERYKLVSVDVHGDAVEDIEPCGVCKTPLQGMVVRRVGRRGSDGDRILLMKIYGRVKRVPPGDDMAADTSALQILGCETMFRVSPNDVQSTA